MVMLAVTAAPAAPSTPAKAAVAQGITPPAVNATPVFPVKASTRETVSFVFKLRNEAELETG